MKKTLLLLVMLFTLTATADTGQWKLILVTVTDHFDPQWGSFETLRECTTEGARLLHDQELYLGFGCVYWGGE